MKEAESMEKDWKTNPRWRGIKRPYSAEEVLKLRGALKIDHTLALVGAQKLWSLLQEEGYIQTLGALTGNQAIQIVQAGLKAIYVSGWQVAADANLSCEMYPDQSLYPSNSVPKVVYRINHSLRRADQIAHVSKKPSQVPDWYVPVVADAEAGFGGPLNVFELMQQLIEAGAAGVHFEDQLSSAKKCGHMGGKVLVPTHEFITKLIAARLAADVCAIPTLLIARTDADSANLLTSNSDERDHPFIKSEVRTPEGFFQIENGLKASLARSLAYAPFADILWCETSTPDLKQAKAFAEGIKKVYPDKMLAYNCSPSFNWKKSLDKGQISHFQKELGAMGYKFQFVTLAGFHTLNLSMFSLANDYKEQGMTAYADFQELEFASEAFGYRATSHQAFVGAGYFDTLTQVISQGDSHLQALKGSTEESHF